MYSLPSDFPHEPPENYTYEVHHYKPNILSIWCCNHSQFVYNDGNVAKSIWGFYNIKKRKYHAPINSKRVGETVALDRTSAYSAMPLLKLALDTDDTPASDAILSSSSKQGTMTLIQNASSKTEFSEFCAQRDARNTIQLNITKYCFMICDALRQNFIDYSIRSHERSLLEEPGSKYHIACIEDLKSGNCGYEFIVETGRKYHKIIMVNNQRSVHAFVDRKTGEMYKAASFKQPAKGVRFNLNIIKEREFVLKNCDWSGGYLYRNAHYTG